MSSLQVGSGWSTSTCGATLSLKLISEAARESEPALISANFSFAPYKPQKIISQLIFTGSNNFGSSDSDLRAPLQTIHWQLSCHSHFSINGISLHSDIAEMKKLQRSKEAPFLGASSPDSFFLDHFAMGWCVKREPACRPYVMTGLGKKY